jgi:hypothetical protein
MALGSRPFLVLLVAMLCKNFTARASHLIDPIVVAVLTSNAPHMQVILHRLSVQFIPSGSWKSVPAHNNHGLISRLFGKISPNQCAPSSQSHTLAALISASYTTD